MLLAENYAQADLEAAFDYREKKAAEKVTKQNHIRVFKDALEMGMSRERAIKLSQITEEELLTIVL